jgi:hypothetical protein
MVIQDTNEKEGIGWQKGVSVFITPCSLRLFKNKLNDE